MSRPDARAARATAPVFAALGDETRLALLRRLDDGEPRSIAELADGLPQTRQGVTKHLNVLKEAGVVTSKRVGRETRYTIRPASVAKARDFLVRASAQWDAGLARLKLRVENE